MKWPFKKSLVDILKKYSEKEIREAIPKAFENLHVHSNPPKTKIWTMPAGRAILDILTDEKLDLEERKPKEKKKDVTGLRGIFL
jgi:hypothetical protein